MKKFFTLLMAVMLSIPLIRAAEPECIYIATLSMMGGEIPVNEEDPTLEPTEDGVYVGLIKNWQKGNYTVGYKKFYTVDGDVMTIYGASGKTGAEQPNLSSGPVVYDLGLQTINKTDGSYKNSGTCGFFLASANTSDLMNVKVTINLNDSKITFEESSDEPAPELPTLESASPAEGSTVTQAEDGSITIDLNFSGKVVSLEALVDGEEINKSTTEDWSGNIKSNDDGTVWTLKVPKSLVETSIKEDNGKLKVTIQKVFAEDQLQVKFGDNNDISLVLVYNVTGLSTMASLKFVGSEEALSALKVYSSLAAEEEDVQFLTGTDEVKYEGESYEFAFNNLIRFLFTVPANYNISVTSTVQEGSSNWTLGTAWSEEKVADESNPEDVKYTYEKVLEGPMLNIYNGSKDAVFTITITEIPATFYISGEFNNNTPGSNAEWAINRDADELAENNALIYNGTVELPKGDNVSFNFVYSEGIRIVPANNQNETLEFDNSEYPGTYKYSGSFTTVAAAEANNWILSAWEGQELSVNIDWDSKTINLQYDVELPEVWYIRGAFNDYNPNYDQKWALTKSDDPDLNGVFSGTFEVPEGKFSFNLLSTESVICIPYMAEETSVKFVKGAYTDSLETAQMEGDDEIYWVDENWEGGEITVTVDLNEGNMVITLPMDFTDNLYLAGEFNQFNPNDDEDWKVAQDEDDNYIYSKYVEIPAEQFSLYFQYGDYYIVPANQTGDEVASENIEVTYGNSNFDFILSKEKPEVYWVNEEWEGGEIGINVNLVEYKVYFQIEEPTQAPDVWYVLCQASDYEPSEDYVLVPSPYDEEGVYVGSFDFASGTAFSFNLQDNNGFVWVPGVEDPEDPGYYIGTADGVVTFSPMDVDDETVEAYVGKMAMAFENDEYGYYWSCPNWISGTVNISVDINVGEITITNVDGTVSVSTISKYNEDDAIYNLQGVKVDANKLSKGIYIVNGKKVLVK